tara:strand:- start:717 stop:2963 length:2247 start_codon:yes stop_codon:yes gene_type:complete
MADSNNFRVLLMTGLTPPDSSKTAQQQVDYFKKGFGDDVPIDQYSYKNPVGLIAAIKKHPDAIVVLYSAGGQEAAKVAKVIPTKEKLFVVEPWCGEDTQSSKRIKIMTTAMASGVPPTNFQSGPEMNRGKGIPGSTKTPTGDGHFAALTYAGKRIRSIYPDGVVEQIEEEYLKEPTYVVYTTNSTITGDIYFKQDKEGYLGELYLVNFPPEANIPINETGKYFYTDYIDEANFDTLKNNLLKEGQKWLDDLKFFDGNENIDVGELKIGVENGVRYQITGVVVDEKTQLGIEGALIKDTTENPSSTKSQSDGSFILNGYYKKSSSTTPSTTFLSGSFQFEGDFEIYNQYDPNDPMFDSFEDWEENRELAINQLSPDLQVQARKSIQKEKIFGVELNNLPPAPEFTLNVSAEGYGQKSNLSPFTLYGKIRSTMGVINLLSNKLELEQTILEETPLTDPQMKAIEIAKMSPEMAIQKAMNRIILEAKTRLLPAVLVMIGEFGITNIQAVLGKSYEDMNATCPIDPSESGDSLARLNKLIERKNNLTRALNKMYNALEKIELGVSIADKALVAAEVVVITLQALTAIPSSLATPQPSITSNIVETIKRQIKKFKLITGSTLMVLNILIQIIEKILQYLALLDTLLNGCIQDFLDDNPDADLAIQQQVSNNLLEATKKQAEQLSPVVTNVNGFDMGVITEDGKTEFDLKRRRAIAKNKAGIIMLKGEPSFSSNDQILIDELVFYIKQNDLKAE